MIPIYFRISLMLILLYVQLLYIFFVEAFYFDFSERSFEQLLLFWFIEMSFVVKCIW